ncbi:hypothetical protein [Undibacterium squillarum]|uniref:Uncharacterized protein n=1 Tax=Undibacterium squillarum TaxID=1131567 RepID=A0ABQ2Y281_9BURK|nr:hypothetical protein [Undibacterium squillarum]GGX53472.1 hypothetical protein GCM10010946_35090 [Undibacterium squillarum]
MQTDDLFQEMMLNAKTAFGAHWQQVSDYLPTELKKMAVQLNSIADNVAAFQLDNSQGYSPATGKLMLQMQQHACVSVLVAMTQLTLLAVQDAVNSILAALRSALVKLASPLLLVL